MLKIILIPVVLIMLYYLEGFIFSKKWHKGLEVDLSFDKRPVVEGDYTYLSEEITNAKIIPLHILQVRFQTANGLGFIDTPNASVSDRTNVSDVFSMMPYEKVTRQLKIECEKRGYYDIQSTSLVAHDLFSSSIHYENQNQNTCLYVYPSQIALSKLEIPFEMIMGDVLTRKNLYEDNFTFRGIREYVRGDTLNSINWKATARTGDLKVNLRENTSSQKVMLLVNLEEPAFLFDEDLIEDCIRVCVTLANEFIKRQVPVGIRTNGKDLITGDIVEMEAGASRGHIQNCNRALARIDLKMDKSSFIDVVEREIADKGYEDTTYVVISTSQRDEFQEAIARLSDNTGHITWLCPLTRSMEDARLDKFAVNGSKIDYYRIVHE
jgi:uncharacterized protein (DUF58 family)